MKALLRSFWVVALGMVVVVGGVWMYVGGHAVEIFNQSMSALVQRKVSVRVLYPAFPLGIVGKGLEIDGLGAAGEFRADMDWAGLARRDGDILSVEIKDPVMVFKRGDGDTTSRATTPQGVSTKIPDRERIIRHVAIHNGTLSFEMRNGKALTVEKIEADLKNVPLAGQSVRTAFVARASVVSWKRFFPGRSLTAQGWVNWADRDMDVKAEALSDDGLMRMNVALVASHNDLLADGTIFLIGGNQPGLKNDEAGVAENVVRDVLGSSQTDIEAKFSFRTQMDRVEIGPISLKGNITTGLNSLETSGTIVQSLKAMGEQFLKDEQSSEVK